MIYSILLLFSFITFSASAEVSDTDVLDWLIDNQKPYHNLSRKQLDMYKRYLSQTKVTTSSTPSVFTPRSQPKVAQQLNRLNGSEISDSEVINWLVENKLPYNNLSRDDLENYKRRMPKAPLDKTSAIIDPGTVDPGTVDIEKLISEDYIAADSSEVLDWLVKLKLPYNGLSSKDFEKYGKEISALKSTGYRFAENQSVSSQISNKLYSGDICYGDDQILVNGESVSIFSYKQELDKHIGAFFTEYSPCAAITGKLLLEHTYKNTQATNNFCKKSTCKIYPIIKKDFNNLVKSHLRSIKRASDESGSCFSQEKQDFALVKKLIGDVKSITECEPVDIGERKLKGSGLEDYLLEKKSDNSYKVTFQLDFQEAAGATSSSLVMNRKVRECLNSTNPKISDQKGRKLELNFVTPEEALSMPPHERPSKTKISIHANSHIHRSHSRGYAGDISCPVIIHELLHLTGLPDEYVESRNGIYIDKVTGQRIVVDHTNAESFLKHLRDIGQSRRGRYNYTPDYNHCRGISKKPSIMNNQNIVFYEALQKKSTSLLRNAHLERIISGSCPVGDVKKYNSCIEDQYVKAGNSCPSRPAYCDDESVWLDLNDN